LESLEELVESDGGVLIEEFSQVYRRFLSLLRAGVPFSAMFIDWMHSTNSEAMELPDDGDDDDADGMLEPAEPHPEHDRYVRAARRRMQRREAAHA
jgi:hypothetical protein